VIRDFFAQFLVKLAHSEERCDAETSAARLGSD